MPTENDLDQDGSHLLFGDDDGGHDDPGSEPVGRRGRRRSRDRLAGSSRREQKRARRQRRRAAVFVTLGAVVIVAIALVSFVVVKNRLETPDYTGSGTGSVRVVINDGDSASDIAKTLKDAGVVKSTKAFTQAAKKNSAAAGLQPGVYTLHRKMSGAEALKLLLNPTSRDAASDVLIPEGATKLDVAKTIAKVLGTDAAAVQKAMDDVGQLSLPTTYATDGKSPTSVEGFLYPATYPIEPDSSPTDVLNQIITNFAAQDRDAGFAGDASSHHITPYEMLTVASIAQSEAKFATDMPKVARVILNRLSAKKPLQVDATSAYGAKLMGLDPTKVIFATLDSPYNSYTHDGLPPTPISNPGSDALKGAADPANGNWLYYVNADAEGHLFFTNSEAAFVKAAAKCKAEGWGCG